MVMAVAVPKVIQRAHPVARALTQESPNSLAMAAAVALPTREPAPAATAATADSLAEVVAEPAQQQPALVAPVVLVAVESV